MIDLGFLEVTDLNRAERRAVAFVAAAGARPHAAVRPERLVWLANGQLGIELVQRQGDWRGLLVIDRHGNPTMHELDADQIPARASIVHVFREFDAPALRLIGGRR